jgi:hypothetical protein
VCPPKGLTARFSSGIGSACFTIGARLERIVFGISFGGGTGFGAVATHLPIARAWLRPSRARRAPQEQSVPSAITPNVLEVMQQD